MDESSAEDARRPPILKQRPRLPLQEVPFFYGEDDATATFTLTQSRRVSFGRRNHVKEYIPGSAASTLAVHEYDESNESMSEPSMDITGPLDLANKSCFPEEGSQSDEEIQNENLPPYIPPPDSFTDRKSAPPEERVRNFTEHCISLAKSVFENPETSLTAIIIGAKTPSAEDDRRGTPGSQISSFDVTTERSDTFCQKLRNPNLDYSTSALNVGKSKFGISDESFNASVGSFRTQGVRHVTSSQVSASVESQNMRNPNLNLPLSAANTENAKFGFLDEPLNSSLGSFRTTQRGQSFPMGIVPTSGESQMDIDMEETCYVPLQNRYDHDLPFDMTKSRQVSMEETCYQPLANNFNKGGDANSCNVSSQSIGRQVSMEETCYQPVRGGLGGLKSGNEYQLSANSQVSSFVGSKFPGDDNEESMEETCAVQIPNSEVATTAVNPHLETTDSQANPSDDTFSELEESPASDPFGRWTPNNSLENELDMSKDVCGSFLEVLKGVPNSPFRLKSGGPSNLVTTPVKVINFAPDVVDEMELTGTNIIQLPQKGAFVEMIVQSPVQLPNISSMTRSLVTTPVKVMTITGSSAVAENKSFSVKSFFSDDVDDVDLTGCDPLSKLLEIGNDRDQQPCSYRELNSSGSIEEPITSEGIQTERNKSIVPNTTTSSNEDSPDDQCDDSLADLSRPARASCLVEKFKEGNAMEVDHGVLEKSTTMRHTELEVETSAPFEEVLVEAEVSMKSDDDHSLVNDIDADPLDVTAEKTGANAVNEAVCLLTKDVSFCETSGILDTVGPNAEKISQLAVANKITEQTDAAAILQNDRLCISKETSGTAQQDVACETSLVAAVDFELSDPGKEGSCNDLNEMSISNCSESSFNRSKTNMGTVNEVGEEIEADLNDIKVEVLSNSMFMAGDPMFVKTETDETNAFGRTFAEIVHEVEENEVIIDSNDANRSERIEEECAGECSTISKTSSEPTDDGRNFRCKGTVPETDESTTGVGQILKSSFGKPMIENEGNIVSDGDMNEDRGQELVAELTTMDIEETQSAQVDSNSLIKDVSAMEDVVRQQLHAIAKNKSLVSHAENAEVRTTEEERALENVVSDQVENVSAEKAVLESGELPALSVSALPFESAEKHVNEIIQNKNQSTILTSDKTNCFTTYEENKHISPGASLMECNGSRSEKEHGDNLISIATQECNEDHVAEEINATEESPNVRDANSSSHQLNSKKKLVGENSLAEELGNDRGDIELDLDQLSPTNRSLLHQLSNLSVEAEPAQEGNNFETNKTLPLNCDLPQMGDDSFTGVWASSTRYFRSVNADDKPTEEPLESVVPCGVNELPEATNSSKEESIAISEAREERTSHNEKSAISPFLEHSKRVHSESPLPMKQLSKKTRISNSPIKIKESLCKELETENPHQDFFQTPPPDEEANALDPSISLKDISICSTGDNVRAKEVSLIDQVPHFPLSYAEESIQCHLQEQSFPKTLELTEPSAMGDPSMPSNFCHEKTDIDENLHSSFAAMSFHDPKRTAGTNETLNSHALRTETSIVAEPQISVSVEPTDIQNGAPTREKLEPERQLISAKTQLVMESIPSGVHLEMLQAPSPVQEVEPFNYAGAVESPIKASKEAPASEEVKSLIDASLEAPASSERIESGSEASLEAPAPSKETESSNHVSLETPAPSEEMESPIDASLEAPTPDEPESSNRVSLTASTPEEKMELSNDAWLEVQTPSEEMKSLSGVSLDTPTPSEEMKSPSGVSLDTPTPSEEMQSSNGASLDTPTPSEEMQSSNSASLDTPTPSEEMQSSNSASLDTPTPSEEIDSINEFQVPCLTKNGVSASDTNNQINEEFSNVSTVTGKRVHSESPLVVKPDSKKSRTSIEVVKETVPRPPRILHFPLIEGLSDKVHQDLIKYSKEEGCPWRLEGFTDCSSNVCGLFEASFPLLDIRIKLSFEFATGDRTCELTRVTQIETDIKPGRCPKYQLVTKLGCEAWKQHIAEEEKRIKGNFSKVPLLMDLCVSFHKRLLPALQQTVTVLKGYAGSRLNGYKLRFRLWSILSVMSCYVEIDVAEMILMGRCFKLNFIHDIGVLDEDAIYNVFREFWTGSTPLLTFIKACVAYLVEEERKVFNRVSKRLPIRF